MFNKKKYYNTAKTTFILLLSVIVCTIACNNKKPNNSADAIGNTKYPFVTATVNGNDWVSVPSEILAKHSEFDDKLQIFTKDQKGKMNFLITLPQFSKTQVGNYSSVKENASGYGISLLDDDKQDNEEIDYDNFRQGAIPNCITVTSIKDVADGKIVTGTFATTMNISNNYDAATSKPISVTNGNFSVLISK